MCTYISIGSGIGNTIRENNNLKNTGEVQEIEGYLGSSGVKNLLANVGVVGFIPASGRSPGEGNGNPLQYLPGKSQEQRRLATTVRGVTKSLTQPSN